MSEIVTSVLAVAGVGILILLVIQRWFWVIVFGIAGLACAFTTLASIIHFQILGALGFFFLMLVCWAAAGWIADA